MSQAKLWKSLFAQWPEGIPRRGILLSRLNEAVPFKGFLLTEDMLLLERTNADAAGARYVLIPFEEINNVKFIDPLKEAACHKAGFEGHFAKT